MAEKWIRLEEDDEDVFSGAREVQEPEVKNNGDTRQQAHQELKELQEKWCQSVS